MKCAVDLVTACDGEALDCGYCAAHHPHLGPCPDGLADPPGAEGPTALDETIDREGPRILEALRREREGAP